jgi:hypothetical protein
MKPHNQGRKKKHTRVGNSVGGVQHIRKNLLTIHTYNKKNESTLPV